MVQQSNTSTLRAAWRALDGSTGEGGWRTIPLEMKGNCRLLAGRYFPGNEEAILVGFRSVSVPQDKNLPQGHGFRVNRIERNIVADGHVWVSLARLAAGSLDMFALMAEDIVNFLNSRTTESEDSIFHAFLGRIRAWQNFMDREGAGILSAEAETGLFGELIILDTLISSGMPTIDAVNAWQGPIDGIQDFLIGTGAIEVKTTASQGSFPAKISSLEQLDNSLVQPLYLAGVRVALHDSGITLPAFAHAVRSKFTSDSAARSIFENRLIQAGLLEAHVDSYTRCFVHSSTVTFHVNEEFPRLTAGNVGIEIRKARYELDLALIKQPDAGIDRAIADLRGV
jgi:Putative  PD-(D/E)XK family member, (DUF4420)